MVGGAGTHRLWQGPLGLSIRRIPGGPALLPSPNLRLSFPLLLFLSHPQAGGLWLGWISLLGCSFLPQSSLLYCLDYASSCSEAQFISL